MPLEKDLQEQLNEVKQPYYDFEIAKICQWLRMHKHKLTMYVSLKGDVVFRDKETREIVKL